MNTFKGKEKMKKKKIISTIMVGMMLASVAIAIAPTVSAKDTSKHQIYGKLYVNDIVTNDAVIEISCPETGYSNTYTTTEQPSGDNIDISFRHVDGFTGKKIYLNLLNRPLQYSVLLNKTEGDVGSIALYFINLNYTNVAPNTPSNPSPTDGATGQNLDVDTSWACSDPDGDALTYDIYFSTTNPPALASSGQTATSYDPNLAYSTPYYWQIVAHDPYGESASGPIWSFTTKAEPYTPPNPNPDPDPDPDPGPGPSPPADDDDDEEEPVLNNPPTKPTVDGNTTGDADTNYTYTAVSTDPDEGQMISYTFDWGDGTNDTTDFFANNTAVNETHQWDVAGVYSMWVEAIDDFEGDNGSLSGKTYLTILIDVMYVKDIGYIIDNDGDGVYENFYNNETENTTATEYDEENESYLINSDGAEGWEWVYEPPTDTLTEYMEEEAPAEPEPEQDNTIYYMLGLGMLLVILLLLAIYYYMKKKEGSKKKTQKKK